jgi:IMP dehydrogenase/GMP reductase
MEFEECLTYDDINIVPGFSTIEHRIDCYLESKITKKRSISVPIVSAPMDTVTEIDMMKAMNRMGGVGALHRFMSIDRQARILFEFSKWIKDETNRDNDNICASIGVTGDFIERAQDIVRNGCNILLIDIAHGHHSLMRNAIEAIRRDVAGEFEIIAGNIATFEAANDLCEWGVDGLRVGVGSGCFAGETRILMANGTYKDIQNIKVGDRVINMNGKPVDVKSIQMTGYKKTIKIRHNKFYKETVVTPNHRYWIGDLSSLSEHTKLSRGYIKCLNQPVRGGDSKFKWLGLDKCDDCVYLLPAVIDFELPNNFEIVLNKRRGHVKSYVVDSVLSPTYELGYVFGLFLGDGNSLIAEHCGRHIGSVCWVFGLDEKNVADKLSGCLRKIFPNASNPTTTIKNNTIQIRFYYKPFADFLIQFGKGKEKHIPCEYLVDDREYLTGIYDGLIDSDGHVPSEGARRVCLTNTSTHLIELFNVLCSILKGGMPNNREQQLGTGLDNMNLENCNNAYVARYGTTTHKRMNDDIQIVKPLDIVFEGICIPVYDIEVDCPTHSFIANNAIVHNSLCETRIRTGVGVPQVSAIMAVVPIAAEFGVPVIADGGVRLIGDVAKALALGANVVMLGSLLSGTKETPGDVQKIGVWPNEQLFKKYRGSSSIESKRDRGEESSNIEGNSKIVLYKGKTKRIVSDIIDGVRSAMSYVGAANLAEFTDKAKFVKVTDAGKVEAKPHLMEV